MGASILACVEDDRTDGIAPIAGGLEGEVAGMSPVKQALLLPSAPDRVAAITTRHGCEPEPLTEPVSDRIERQTWVCPVGAAVEPYVHDGGHGLRPVGHEMLWEFFGLRPLPD